MRKLGLVGGIGPASTIEYYKSINEGYCKSLKNPAKCGENPPIIIDSLNLAVAYDLAEKEDWSSFAELFINSIRSLHLAGAEIAAITANTAHIVFDAVQAQSPIPLIGLIDETCKYAQNRECKRVVVLGTAFTMRSRMYENKCSEYGIEATVPNEADQKTIQNIIFPNLVAGIVQEHEKSVLLEIARRVIRENKADALVLGCTELPLAITENDLDTLLLDTTKIHIDSILAQICY